MSRERALKNTYTYVGILLVLEGLLFLIVPHFTIKLLYMTPLKTAQAEQYVRTTGLAIIVIGYYYYVAGINTLIAFFRASVVGRLCILPILLFMAYFWSLELPLLLIGIQDSLTAIWSYIHLKAYDAEQKKLKN